MTRQGLASRPFGKTIRTTYYLLATLNLVALSVILYFNVDLAHVAQTMQSDEVWATRISSIDNLEVAAGDVDDPGNSAFASGDTVVEATKMTAAVARFRSSLSAARSVMGNETDVIRELGEVENGLGGMVAETSEVFRLLDGRDVKRASVAMARLDRAYAAMRADLLDIRRVLRDRQLAGFAAHATRGRVLAHQQKVGVAFMALLVIAMLGYGRQLNREVITSTEREKYLQQLKQREDELRATTVELLIKQQSLEVAQRMAQMGTYERDLTTDALWWSDELYSIFQMRPEDGITYERFLERVAPEDVPQLKDAIANAMAARKPFSVEIRVRVADGSERVVTSIGRFEFDSNDRPIRLRGVVQDITERKWAEEQLLKQEAQLAEAQRIARTGSWEFEVKTKVVRWSDELHEILGYGSGDVVPSFRAYMSLLPPAEKSRVYAMLQQAMASESRFEFEHALIRHDDGVPIHVYVQGVIDRDADGQPVRVLGVSQDITARKESEEALRISEDRFRLAARATNDVIWDWDLADDVCWVNENFASRLHYPAWGRIEISRLHPVHPDDRERVEASISAAVTGNARDWSAEYRFRDGNGNWRDIFDRGYIVRDASGTAVRMIGAMADITERRSVERMKDEFISTVSHELRTPLTAIRGALGLLSSGRLGALPEKGQRLLEIASSNTDRLVRLINDILDIERIESGKVTLAKEQCDAATLVAQTVDVVRPLADRERITIEVNTKPAPLIGDPDRLIQALTNLVGNAVKFSPAGSAVTVTAETRGREVVFSVADRGRGIPADKLATLFERFQQVDASDARDKGGSGLGLAISRSIVRQHGGDITVESELGKGSTFTIVMPTGIAAPEPQADGQHDGKLIYICDDDEDTRAVLSFFLSSRGYRVREFASGLDLLDALRAEKPDAILLDIFMPDMNGWEALARLKKDPETRDIPVVVVSILSRDDTGNTGIDFSGWIQKPFNEDALTRVVDQAFRAEARPPRLVLVEDDNDLASVITASLERYGIETIHARNGQEAIEIARRVNPDLLILDLILPGIDGYGVVDWLKDHEFWRGLPLVVYSATEPTPSQRERLQLGYTEFMTKSRVAPEEFERRIVSLLETLTAKKGAANGVA